MDKNKRTDDTVNGGEKQVFMSTEGGSVAHDHYIDGRRTNYGHDRKTTLLGS